MIIAQQGNFTVIVTQERDPSALKPDPKGVSSEEKKEGEAERRKLFRMRTDLGIVCADNVSNDWKSSCI